MSSIACEGHIQIICALSTIVLVLFLQIDMHDLILLSENCAKKTIPFHMEGK